MPVSSATRISATLPSFDVEAYALKKERHGKGWIKNPTGLNLDSLEAPSPSMRGNPLTKYSSR
jgi:hypothetical protein